MAAAGAGKVSMQDFHFVMSLNRASPGLMKACATGQHIKEAMLSARKAGKGQQDYLTFKFYDVLISSFQTGGSESASVNPTDQVSFNFQKIEMEYKPQKPDGTFGALRPLQVRPEGEQDLLARRPAAAVEPVRAVPPPGRPDPPRAESPQAAVELARLLRVAGYESPRIQERLATGDELLARSPELPSYLRRLGDADELAVLLRLFLLGVPVARARLDELVGTQLRARLAGAGLLVEEADVVHGAARLVPHDELLIASDHAGAAEAHADHVPGVHRPSVALAHLTVRGEGERALDLCTGNGIQAILLAAHAEHVVATDVNARALALRGLQRSAQRRRQRRDATRQLLRAGRGRAVRPRRREPAVRRLTRERVPVPGRRHARRRRLGARRARQRRPPSRPARSPPS